MSTTNNATTTPYVAFTSTLPQPSQGNDATKNSSKSNNNGLVAMEIESGDATNVTISKNDCLHKDTSNNAPLHNIPQDLIEEGQRQERSDNNNINDTTYNPYTNEEEKNDCDDDVSMTIDVSSVITAEGIHDVQGFYVVCFIILLGDMARGVMFPTMWPLVELMGGTTITLGYAVASFSFGRVIVSPIFGSWSVTWGYTNTLTFSTCILLLGTLCYGQIQNIGRKEFLILSQTLLGVGSGTLGVTRAFVADVTATRERTSYMAFITAVQYGGFTMTPFIGSLFSVLLKDVDVNFGPIRINCYTMPAYFMAILCIILLLLIKLFFRNRMRIKRNKKESKHSKPSRRRTEVDVLAQTTNKYIGLTTYDCCIIGCMLLNIATKGSIASFETVGITYAETYFNMYPSKAGSIIATCGTLGVVSLLCMGCLERHVKDTGLISFGIAIMCVGIFSLTFVHGENNATWHYILAMFLIYSIGYPVGHTAVIGLFSKIVGRRPQGTLMGWFASAGSLARILFPIMTGYVVDYESAIALFVIVLSILIISYFFVLYNHETLTKLSQ